MKLIERNTCVVSQMQDLDPLYTFKGFPVFMGCTQQSEGDDRKVDMSWCISRSSGLIQLKSLLPLDVLYPESHGAGCVGELWNKHHKAFSDFIHEFKPSAIFEIGGAHGILAHEYSKLEDVSWTIVEPNPSPISESKAHFIKGFFDENFQMTGSFDAVVHSHVFEHIYEPDEFMKHLSRFIANGKYLIFSIPNMQVMLERKYTNCINLEHTIFLTEPYVDYLLARYGFRFVRKEYFMDDHSIFYAAVKDSSVTPRTLQKDLYEKNKKLYLDYVNYHNNLILELNKKISLTKQDIYLFGAHVFAQYLIAFGLDTSRIVSLLDNDPKKQGKRLYGTALKVNSPSILKDKTHSVVILKAGVYNNEIKSEILNKINRNVEFWE